MVIRRIKAPAMKPGARTLDYAQEFRRKLGFSNQGDVKDFFGGGDIVPTIDQAYLTKINKRLRELIDKIDSIVPRNVSLKDKEAFKKEHIDEVFGTLKRSGILPRLNNQGRRPEQVYYSWMRGHVMTAYFMRALTEIFGVSTTKIKKIGKDDFTNPKTFIRAADADLEVILRSGEKLCIEMQTGFKGVNDIKKHKFTEAKRIFSERGDHSVVIHFDLFNGRAAIVILNKVDESKIKWEPRAQMEGQLVMSIPPSFFNWKLTEPPPNYHEL